jgi:hypothetical protein
MKLLRSGVAWGLVVSAGLWVWVLVDRHGWSYYRTPITIRGYAPAHAALRPSGPFGQTFGVVGAALILVPFLYMARKRMGRRGALPGTTRGWLEVHLFCGIVGPMLVTMHTAFKFNGIVSAAYWAMMMVMLSGFVGRYLYVRIPRTIRGTELTRAELDAKADALHVELLASAGTGSLLDRIAAVERSAVPAGGRATWMGLLSGEIGLRRRLRALRHEIRRSALGPGQQDELVRLATERALLLRRVAYLQQTKVAFGLWHVFHLPLVYLMLVIVSAHVALALYMGYVPFRW